MKKPVALFSVSSLGLGHASRTLPLIQSYQATHDIHIISAGNALTFFREEVKDAFFYECQDYPPLERGRGFGFYWHIIVDSIITVVRIRREHTFVQSLIQKIHPQFIISDGRYGSYDEKIPSFLISHQISFVMPRGLGIFQGIADFFNHRAFNQFTSLIIPDYEYEGHSLAGALSHHPMLARLKHEYVGILSAYRKVKMKKDVEALFVISGYLLEHRQRFISSLLERARAMSGKKVFILGNPREEKYSYDAKSDIEMYGLPSHEVKMTLFNRAQRVISRSGYTTIMDLAELGIPGDLVATPGQTEQEYLAQHLEKKGLMGAVIQVPWTTESSIGKIHTLVSQYLS